jgi:hypothetical protein
MVAHMREALTVGLSGPLGCVAGGTRRSALASLTVAALPWSSRLARASATRCSSSDRTTQPRGSPPNPNVRIRDVRTKRRPARQAAGQTEARKARTRSVSSAAASGSYASSEEPAKRCWSPGWTNSSAAAAEPASSACGRQVLGGPAHTRLDYNHAGPLRQPISLSGFGCPLGRSAHCVAPSIGVAW